MLNQAYKLRQVSHLLFLINIYSLDTQPIALFVTSADEIFGPITTLRHDNRVERHIPWSAFKMVEQDWTRVIDARDILAVSIHLHTISRTNSCFRTPIESNIIFLLKSSPRSGAHFPHSKSCKRHGRRSARVHNMSCMGMPLVTASRKSGNTIHAWTKSQHLFSPLVSNFF